MTASRITLEVCVDSLRGARIAQEAGADRIELCASLVLGGTTPGPGLLEAVVEAVDLPVVVLIRPRPGDFHYDQDECLTMVRDVQAARRAGAAGVAVGALDAGGAWDERAMKAMVEAAEGLPCVCHRAFDVAREREQRLEELMELGFQRVLTSGGEESASLGCKQLASWVRQAAGRIEILAGAGVRSEHVAQLVQESGVREVHASAGRWLPGPMQHRPSGPNLGSGEDPHHYERRLPEEQEVRALRTELDKALPG